MHTRNTLRAIFLVAVMWVCPAVSEEIRDYYSEPGQAKKLAGVLAQTKKAGRLGNQKTRAHVEDVANTMEKRGWKIEKGGGNGRSEEYLKGAGGGTKGSSYPDITATKNGKTLRVNTVDTRADGITPTTREAANAARIRTQTGEHVLTVPKPK